MGVTFRASLPQITVKEMLARASPPGGSCWIGDGGRIDLNGWMVRWVVPQPILPFLTAKLRILAHSSKA
jgi:hypothetical protein